LAEVVTYKGEDIEKAIKRFKKTVDREGILLEVKKRRYYAKPAVEKHEKLKKMERKRRKKMMRTKKLY
jgi:small subunit ribosomal protein S21